MKVAWHFVFMLVLWVVKAQRRTLTEEDRTTVARETTTSTNPTTTTTTTSSTSTSTTASETSTIFSRISSFTRETSTPTLSNGSEPETISNFVWVIAIIVATCLAISVLMTIYLYCCKRPKNPLAMYPVSIDRPYAKNPNSPFDKVANDYYGPPKLFAEYEVPTKKVQEKPYRGQGREIVGSFQPVPMDDGYYYYDVNGNPTDPYYFDENYNVVFVDQNGFPTRTVPNPQLNNLAPKPYDDRSIKKPHWSMERPPAVVSQDPFQQDTQVQRNSSMFMEDSRNSKYEFGTDNSVVESKPAETNQAIMDWFDPKEVTEDYSRSSMPIENSSRDREIMEWFNNPIKVNGPSDSKPGLQQFNVVENDSSEIIDINLPKNAHVSGLDDLETLSKQLWTEYGLDTTDLSKSKEFGYQNTLKVDPSAKAMSAQAIMEREETSNDIYDQIDRISHQSEGAEKVLETKVYQDEISAVEGTGSKENTDSTAFEKPTVNVAPSEKSIKGNEIEPKVQVEPLNSQAEIHPTNASGEVTNLSEIHQPERFVEQNAIQETISKNEDDSVENHNEDETAKILENENPEIVLDEVKTTASSNELVEELEEEIHDPQTSNEDHYSNMDKLLQELPKTESLSRRTSEMIDEYEKELDQTTTKSNEINS